jgi:excinuclease UvrABC nuclease subunit
MKKPCVYIAKCKDGDVIYIGMTLNLKTRMDGHNALSTWFDDCHSIEIVHCKSKDDALGVEKSLILKFRPKFNSIHVIKNKKTRLPCSLTKRRIVAGIFKSHLRSAISRSGDNINDKRLNDIAYGKVNIMTMRQHYSYACSKMCMPLSADEYYGLFK